MNINTKQTILDCPAAKRTSPARITRPDLPRATLRQSTVPGAGQVNPLAAPNRRATLTGFAEATLHPVRANVRVSESPSVYSLSSKDIIQ
jgi:hypothetical protein